MTADTLEKRDREMAAKFQNMESKQDKMFALLSELSKQSSCSSAGFDEPRAQVQVVDDQYEGCGDNEFQLDMDEEYDYEDDELTRFDRNLFEHQVQPQEGSQEVDLAQLDELGLEPDPVPPAANRGAIIKRLRVLAGDRADAEPGPKDAMSSMFKVPGLKPQARQGLIFCGPEVISGCILCIRQEVS